MLKWAVLSLMVSVTISVPAAENSHTLNYVYIDASEGNSSGGHVALQFDGAVYHFQHVEPGLIRLFRENTGDFEYRYRYLENRNLEVSRIGVAEDTFQLLRDHFELRYQVQKRQFELLRALGQEASLLKTLANPKRASEMDGLPIPGAGLFFDPQQLSELWHEDASRPRSPVLASLRRQVQQRYGAGFLTAQIRSIDQKLRHLAPPDRNPADFDLPTQDIVPSSDYTFYHRYRDLVIQRLALQTLEEARSLRPGTYLAPQSDEFRLSAGETAALCHFREALTGGILDLLHSRRPDPGYALMVQMARLIVVTRSCESGTLAFLDLFVDDARPLPLEEIPQRPGFWSRMAERKRQDLRQVLKQLDTEQALTETAYSILEMNANGYLELLSGLDAGRPVRLFGLSSLPDHTLTLHRLPPSNLSPSMLGQASEQTDRIRRTYLESLKRFYRYQLFNKNCVTEIFHTMDEGFAQAFKQGSDQKRRDIQLAAWEESVRRLGGHIDPGLPDFIPFVSSQAVRKRFRIASTQRLDSFRQGRLRVMPVERKNFLAYLRETNTLTSTLYQPNGADSLFLFFTDDALLPRPLFGAANTLTALLQSIAGLFMLPVDGGNTLHQGALGMMSSLAELAFFNIRKGSYYYAPPGKPGLASPTQ